MMKMTMTARLLVKSHRKGTFGREGNNAVRTCGMLSPTMMQNATMPPKALALVRAIGLGLCGG